MESNENVDPFLEEDYRRTGLGSPPPPPRTKLVPYAFVEDTKELCINHLITSTACTARVLILFCWRYTWYNIGLPGQIRKFISQLYFLCIQIRRFWHYGVNLLF